LNHAELTERVGLEFYLHILYKRVILHIFLQQTVQEGMIAMVLDPRFRAVPVTGHEISSKMRTATLQTGAHEECELMLRLQLQALCSLGLKFETFKDKQLSKKTHWCVKGVKDI
jgi:hypothetical protein